MEQIKKDLNKLRVFDKDEEKKHYSFLDLVGNDIDSSYEKPMTVQISSAQNIFSVGGLQNLGENTQIQIQLTEDMTLHNLKQYMIVGEFTGRYGYPKNFMHLFEAVQADIGSYSIAFTNSRFYQEQKFLKRSQKEINKIKGGLRYYQSNYLGGENTLYQTYDNGISINLAQNCDYVADDGNLDTEYKIRFAVPLNTIFPFLDDIPDSVLYTGLGQKIQLNMRTTMAKDIMIKYSNAGTPYYTLNKMQLVRQYSKLDTIRNDMILKSSVQIPICKYTWYGSSLSNSPQVINAYYNVGQKDRIKGLYFGYHPNYRNNANSDGVTAVDLENIVTNRDRIFYLQYPMSTVALPIKQIDINVSGHVYQYNMQQLKWMDFANDVVNDYNSVQQLAGARIFNSCYFLDLSRFHDDLIGSSSKEITSITIAIQLDLPTKTIAYQKSDWTVEAPANGNASVQNYNFQSFLETQQFIECKNGIYQ